ncbi:MAG: zf-HC2 domain-containing protein [Verrucomicrobiota bacterium]|nr:zf-HC2 domain-containing protein [Verrucomicrobiota bacterium]
MLTCKEVSELVSESLEHQLSLRQRMGVQLHLMMCSLCRTYKRQTLQLRELLLGVARREPSEHLSKDAARRIKQALESEQK